MIRWSAPDEVAALHRRFLVEEALSIVRHDARNKLGAIRNAAFYLKKKVSSQADALWTGDRRVPQFFAIIEDEVAAAEARLGGAYPAVTEGSIAVGALIGDPAVDLRALGDAAELGVALVCLVENALDAAGAFEVSAREAGAEIAIDVVDAGPGFAEGAEARALEPGFTTKPARLGLGLNIARRIAARAGGRLELTALERGVRATLWLRRP
jgi:signal transduction histidine kinase